MFSKEWWKATAVRVARTMAQALITAIGADYVGWRTDVKEAALVARGDLPTITGAVKLSVQFFMPRPASVKPAKRPLPIVAPDLDKLVRAVGDALKAAGVYKDDCLIVSIQATKVYATDEKDLSPGAWIVVSEIA